MGLYHTYIPQQKIRPNKSMAGQDEGGNIIACLPKDLFAQMAYGLEAGPLPEELEN